MATKEVKKFYLNGKELNSINGKKIKDITINGITYVLVTKLTVTFVANGSTHATRQVDPNAAIGYSNMPSNPTRSNDWTFMRWVYGTNNSTFSYNTKVVSNLTVTAYWRRATSSFVQCSRCNGTGRVNETCSYCYGTGKRSCNVCGGDGYIEGGQSDCWRCEGSGVVYQCNNCGTEYSMSTFTGECDKCGATSGFNEVSCGICGGGGMIETSGHSCGNCDGTGKVTCWNCDGDGSVSGTCPTCDGDKYVEETSYEYQKY